MTSFPRPEATAVACLAIVACAACARSRPWIGAPPARPAGASDSLLVLVPLRTQDRIRADLDQANARVLAAEADMQAARLLQMRARTAIEVKAAQKKSVQASLDLAEQEKDVVAESEWESKKRLAEMELDLLEQREALRGGEIAVASAQRDQARAEAAAFEAELQLAIKREQRGLFAGREPTAEVVAGLHRLDGEIEALERRTLEAQIDSARSRENVASKAADLASRRLEVLEAQSKLLRGR